MQAKGGISCIMVCQTSSSYSGCHSERSEESLCQASEILSAAKNDSLMIAFFIDYTILTMRWLAMRDGTGVIQQAVMPVRVVARPLRRENRCCMPARTRRRDGRWPLPSGRFLRGGIARL